MRAAGGAPRELRLLRTEKGVVAFVTLGLDPGSTLAEAHARASEVEERLRRARPDVADVIVHTEPSMRLCMFTPADSDLERGWPGRIDGDVVVQLAAQTLQSFFASGSSAREHAAYPTRRGEAARAGARAAVDPGLRRASARSRSRIQPPSARRAARSRVRAAASTRRSGSRR